MWPLQPPEAAGISISSTMAMTGTMAAAAAAPCQLSQPEFDAIRAILFRRTGISMSPAKKALVVGRLSKRMRALGMTAFSQYVAVMDDDDEIQLAINLLTTNETHFFREPAHFDFLRERFLARRQGQTPFRVWSAACSSGEEPYTIAMVLAQAAAGAPWEVHASDISTDVLRRAAAGRYAMERAQSIPRAYLRGYCLKGVGPEAGSFIIKRELRRSLRFYQINLNEALPAGLGRFDMIFLRNVMIYFDTPTKAAIVERLSSALNPGGHLLIGHCETLNWPCEGLEPVQASIYRRRAA